MSRIHVQIRTGQRPRVPQAAGAGVTEAKGRSPPTGPCAPDPRPEEAYCT